MDENEKAEIERLKAENAALKARNEALSKPKKTETYKLLIALKNAEICARRLKHEKAADGLGKIIADLEGTEGQAPEPEPVRKLDMAIVESAEKKRQEKLIMLRNVVAELEKNSRHGAPIQEIADRMAALGEPVADIEKLLKRASREMGVYNPKEGYWKTF